MFSKCLRGVHMGGISGRVREPVISAAGCALGRKGDASAVERGKAGSRRSALVESSAMLKQQHRRASAGVKCMRADYHGYKNLMIWRDPPSHQPPACPPVLQYRIIHFEMA